MEQSRPIIRSPQNNRVKELRKFLRSPWAAETPWIAFENLKTVSGLSRQQAIQLLVVAENHREPIPEAREVLFVHQKVLQSLTQLESSSGLVAFFEKPSWNWRQMPSTLLLLDQLQDPGNLGTILRSAAACNAGIVTTPGTVSCFNPKASRASAGTIFQVPVRESESAETIQEKGYRLILADPEGKESLFETDLTPPLAVAIGNEGHGLEQSLFELADNTLHIPVAAGAPSLNAAIAGALILFETRRRAVT